MKPKNDKYYVNDAFHRIVKVFDNEFDAVKYFAMKKIKGHFNPREKKYPHDISDKDLFILSDKIAVSNRGFTQDSSVDSPGVKDISECRVYVAEEFMKQLNDPWAQKVLELMSAYDLFDINSNGGLCHAFSRDELTQEQNDELF